MVSSTVKPKRSLAAFTQVELAPGEGCAVFLEVKPKAMGSLDPQYHWSVEPGEFQVFLGDNAEDMILQDDFSVISSCVLPASETKDGD